MESLLAGSGVVWAVEPDALVGHEFSVDELLDFSGLMEQEQGCCVVEEDSHEADTSSSAAGAGAAALSCQLLPQADIGFPDDDAAELEWVSHFVDDSFSECPPCSGGSVSPCIPVGAENRPAESSGKLAPSSGRPVCWAKARRSKRSRSGGIAWSICSLPPFTKSSSSSSFNSCSSSYSSSCLISDLAVGDGYPEHLLLLEGSLPPTKEQKKRGRKPKPRPPPAAGSDIGRIGERRCRHCGAQKTPQWRAGPLGPKTLCNACGVRYKSGRLLPEYRPACSPTFLSHAHSNSHSKVLELRRENQEAELLAGGGDAGPLLTTHQLENL